MMTDKLNIIKTLLEKYPDSHVGGSIGLFLHGVDLKRNLNKSDIDFTVTAPIDFSQPMNIENLVEPSAPGDFEYSFRMYHSKDGATYTKIEISINPAPIFDIIVYDGYSFRVTKKDHIIMWKKLYASKGSLKHEHDMIVINGGERPMITEERLLNQLMIYHFNPPKNENYELPC